MEIGRLFDVSGKRALVTGASIGIGYMIAEGLVRAGVEVSICARREKELLIAVERLSELGRAHGIVADMGTECGIDAICDHIRALGPLHILVNNAGATWGAPLDTFPRAGFEKVLALNLMATFDLTRKLLPVMRDAARPDDPARIINITSIDGLRPPVWENYPYSATKAGLNHLTRHLGKALAPDNISVNAIAPGFFPTKMTGAVRGSEAEQVALSPLGSRSGLPEDVIGGVLYLSSRAGAWVTGAIIPIGGGQGTLDG